jgi:hypothetical protein
VDGDAPKECFVSVESPCAASLRTFAAASATPLAMCASNSCISMLAERVDLFAYKLVSSESASSGAVRRGCDDTAGAARE